METTGTHRGPRIAIFGGTFDPIHNAHLRIAREAADTFALDQVLFITSCHPPHKTAGATTGFEHRHHMVELACEADPRFVPSRIEEGRGTSYSIATIRKVRAGLDAAATLFFLIGADAFAEIGSWYKSSEVVRSVEFIVVSRPGYAYPVPEGSVVHRLETLALPVSSSQIRQSLQQGQGAGDLPESVAYYAEQHGLYQTR
ncbi:MAG TPA: nicotinate-nucleotide adenylyltransferase [Bryobacteraceae bacterium]|nr:nicotinate-nucleotide adenylyltransferase [Bryobacteraceae bacterium]